jgi:hypothetical protein
LFGGALFAGALFGGASIPIDKGAGGPKVVATTYWSWTGDKFVYGDTIEAIIEALKINPTAPVLRVAKKVIKLPKPPKAPALISHYIVEVAKFADNARESIKIKHDQDELALMLITLGIIESDQLVIV